MPIISKTFSYGNETYTLETGRIARQATAAVMVTCRETVVLVTVVAKKEADPECDFFPLTVHYQEPYYAAGRFPGGFVKREGKPSEKEILTSRLIDRPIRPLFPDNFYHEIQVIAKVLSLAPDTDASIAAMLGVSAALSISGVPFQGPLGAAKVGYHNGFFILNPSLSELTESELDLTVAGTEQAVLMVESSAKELSEKDMLEAIMFGHEKMQQAIQAIKEFAAEVNTQPWDWQPAVDDVELEQAVRQQCLPALESAYQIVNKKERHAALDTAREQTITALLNAGVGDSEQKITAAFAKVEKQWVRSLILQKGQRIDGRDTQTVRPIDIQIGQLPRAHGSALFTRGETQAVVVATLGTERDAQIIDALAGESKDLFLLHYNFPPYSTGETGPLLAPKRREIGHGSLAKRAMQAVMPSKEQFPYVIRVVSEITESNGSSSMATVCGTSLALMDAGVPISLPVAGIAMGLIKEKEQFAILSDILGDEDHLGDMDFKVAGTERGVTALQMDIKVSGITREILEAALNQAKVGRLHILRLMQQVISEPRAEIAKHAPRIISFRINPEKIRDVIGKGGSVIKGIIETTGTTIDITDEGVVSIAAIDSQSGLEAKRRIEKLTADVEVGRIYEGTVQKITDFGAFVNILPGKDGLVHISQVSVERIHSVSDVLSEGQTVRVKVMEIDKQGRIRLSMREV